MDLKQMEYFITIADEASFSSAARKLHMSQPPLSMQIKNLEEELGTSLFLRNSRHVSLTESGKIFYQRATAILALSKATTNEIADITKNKSFHFGVTPTTIPTFLPYLKDLYTKHNNIHYEIYDDDTFSLVDLLNNGVVEAACIRTPIKTNGIETVVLKEERMIATSDIDLASKLTLTSLVKYPLVIYRRYYDFITDVFNQRNLKANIVCVCNDARSSISLATELNAVAVLPESMLPMCKGHNTAFINDSNLKTKILFAYPKNTHSILVKELLQIIKEKRKS